MTQTAPGTTVDTVRRYGHFIGGSWRGAATQIDRRSPVNGKLVATFAEGTAEDVDAAVDAARAAFDGSDWPTLPGVERARLLHTVADAIRRDTDRLALIEVAETGKTIKTARSDLEGTANHFEFAAGLATTVHGESWDNLGSDLAAVNVREPVGVAALIVPWNFPALILAQKLPYALAAGCTVVIKPAETTSGTACELVRLCHEAGVPAGVVNLVTGYGPVAGQALTEHMDVDFVSFTGSTASGRRVVEASAGNLKRLSLELGGKAATIVFNDAELDDAVDAALFAITFNQGECCVSGTRLLVQSEIADDFVHELVSRARRLRVGDPYDEDTDIGALIHEQHLDRVLGFIKAGVEDGATLRTGGARIGEDASDGTFLAPTVFDHVSPTARIFTEEIFGPVLSVTRFDTTDEAIELANAVTYGLANSVWTKNIDTAHQVTRRLRSGTVWVNTTIDGAPQLPLGGYKQSGYGRETGQHGMEEFTNLKSIQTRIGRRTPAYPHVS